jgi:NADH:ubiquinone oxidoreductase subunit D
MPDPQLEEFCRIRGVADCRPDVFRRLQRHVADTVQPRLDERERLLVENEELLTKVTALETRVTSQQAAKAAKASAAPKTAEVLA